MKRIAPALLLVIGLAQMAGDVFHIVALKAIAAATGASPAPKVFSAVRGAVLAMKNGWTGVQYSVYRVLFGAYLFVHFAMLIPWSRGLFSRDGMLPDGSPLLHLFPNILALNDSAAMVIALIVIATIASIFFAIGLFDRSAAIVIWYILACTFGRNPLIVNPSLPFAGWLLFVHFFLPPAPYGSFAARKRVDPRGGWQMPPSIFAVAWIVMSI